MEAGSEITAALLPRDARYWNRVTQRMYRVKYRVPPPSLFPWYGKAPHPTPRFIMPDAGGPSPHLSWKELACHDGTAYPAVWRETRAVMVAAEFEALRALAGHAPLQVTSAYRTPEWNRRVGGAPHSQHVLGRALDLPPPPGLSIEEWWDIVYTHACGGSSKIRGLGRYRGFVHVDIRPASRLVLWTGAGVGRDEWDAPPE